MNLIKTVGDLKKALSVYEDDLILDIDVNTVEVILNNDTQIYFQNGAMNDKYLKISLIVGD